MTTPLDTLSAFAPFAPILLLAGLALIGWAVVGKNGRG